MKRIPIIERSLIALFRMLWTEAGLTLPEDLTIAGHWSDQVYLSNVPRNKISEYYHTILLIAHTSTLYLVVTVYYLGLLSSTNKC